MVEFFHHLLFTDSVTHIVFVFSCVITLGLAIGGIRIFNIQLGVAGILFAGILFGHFGISVNPVVLHFAKEFGLILFVYTIGLQVGPSFISSFYRNGLVYNSIAALIVLAGVGITFLIIKFAHIPAEVAVGILCGATTNTPSLGAVQQVLINTPGIDSQLANMPALGYAVAYPFGILGIILAMLVMKWIFRINVKEEEISHQPDKNKLVDKQDVLVENSNVNGMTLKEIPFCRDHSVVVSRIQRGDKTFTPDPDFCISLGDILRVVATKEKLKDFQLAVGSMHRMESRGVTGDIIARRIVVTNSSLNGRSITELAIRTNYSVVITRVHRNEVEFVASADVFIRFGDALTVVGKESDILRFSQVVGNTPKNLDHPHLIPVFMGILLGVILGTIPLHIPGLSSPVKLGLAGGPLIVALILSHVGHIGKLNWYMPASANYIMREIGISLFLSCVGLSAGSSFVELLTNGDGLLWMSLGVGITFIPLFLAVLVGRIVFKLRYLTLCGILAGSMTDPPALAYANSLSSSNMSSIGYASVYPLTMLMRILSVQLIMMFFI